MEYTLMHKNIPILDFDLDALTSSIQRIGEVYHLEHLPLGTASLHGGADRTALAAFSSAATVSTERWKR